MLNYITYGRQAEHGLILIHAMGADLRFWDDAARLLSEHAYCVAPDLRSAGQSPQSDRPVLPEQHLDDIEMLRRHVGLKRVTLVGCAMGGLLGALYAARYPDLVDALVMTNPGLRNTDAAKAMLRERVGQIAECGMGFLVPGAVDRSFHRLPRDERYARFLAQYAAQDANAYVQSVLGFLDIDISGVAPGIGCPVLLIPGEHDILMAPEDGPALARMMPDAVLRPMSHAAHFVPYQAPERFAAEVATFLRQRSGGLNHPISGSIQ